MYLLVGVMEIVIETGSCTYLWGYRFIDRDWTMYLLVGVMVIVLETGPCTSLRG